MFDDATIPVTCSECNQNLEGIFEVEEHILSNHPSYTPQEAKSYARIWADDAYETFEMEEIERSEYYREHGIDLDDIDNDPL